ncbi:MAG: hypothetical protein LBO67_08800 [Spirochaetaceae bacterium]|nr:hypothetical protein [Spirochaetaceae bacterium]
MKCSVFYTKEPAVLESARGLAWYFLNHIPDDLVAYRYLIFIQRDERDNSASAIAACGLLVLSAALSVGAPERRLFEYAALHRSASLAQSYTTKTVPESNGILLHGVYGKPENNGVDECAIFGDYFYTELLLCITASWRLYW